MLFLLVTAYKFEAYAFSCMEQARYCIKECEQKCRHPDSDVQYWLQWYCLNACSHSHNFCRLKIGGVVISGDDHRKKDIVIRIGSHQRDDPIECAPQDPL